MRGRRNTTEDFWELVDRSDACWVWRGRVEGNYGRFCFTGKNWLVHNLVHYWETGNTSNRKHYICHTCDNSLCVNPKHLYYGTPITNAQDRVRRGRHVNWRTMQIYTQQQEVS